MEILNHTEHLY